jgi:predicted transcriptional regulator
MVRRNIGRLVVTDEAKSLIGIIDRADVLRGLLGW